MSQDSCVETKDSVGGLHRHAGYVTCELWTLTSRIGGYSLTRGHPSYHTSEMFPGSYDYEGYAIRTLYC